jgi:hypothetical protein
MKQTVVEIRAQNERPLNAISLKNAVLCADCDVVSDSPHDNCRVCGSCSLFNLSRILGGTLPAKRTRLVSASRPIASLPQPVLIFPGRQRVLSVPQRRRRFKSS